ncbi:formamidase [Halogeometricum luteum]|uniref:Acetamidase/formamidase family protein n=1 Tax=Halogeometricum luteum TaxID=2950537 RepID=A0ABU2G2M3_9EURY|nr:formamidase [Halogeometricum sp. S3BR5-2]MDS0294553.1 acetamidase/formamidase family protein [Halogeometricum sp. S3BR5-2]
MPEVKFEVDVDSPPDEQPGANPFNRWHPDIPAAVEAEPGETMRLEALDWTGGQIADDDNANDVRDVDLSQVHYLAGPVHVEGAEPGDLLKVEFLDMGVLNDRCEFGFTGTFSRQNGGGFLTDHFPDAAKSVWDIDGYTVSSRHIPDVRYEGKIHPGLAGCAPSEELLEEWNERERNLVERHEADPESIHNHPTGEEEPGVANLPTTEGAQMGEMDPEVAEEAAETAARTVPPREHGGNHDIKDLSIGSTVYFPVYVEGAKFGVGDFHASQGDGEITFCGAIEMPGYVDVEFDLVKGGMEKHGVDHPIFEPGHRGPHFEDYVTFCGYSVTEDGEQHYIDSHVAYRRACLQAIDYLKKFGYTGQQAYHLLGTVPVEGRQSGVVDVPNACSTLALPKGVFEFDVSPGGLEESKSDRGDLVVTDDPLG